LIGSAEKVTPEETFQQLLGLGPSWRVVRTEFEVEQNTFVLCVEETEALWPEESARCGQTVTCYDHVEPMQWRHLNVFNKECVIVSALPRGRRQKDGKVYRVTPPWEGRSKHFSKEFEAFALTLMREMPVKKAGEILGETDQRLWRMLHAHVEAARAQADWSEVTWVGADEMNRKKGHNYVTVFADLLNKRVLFGVEGKDAGVWQSFAQELQAHNGHSKAITQVAIDMSPAFIKGVRENFGNAQLVFDKFHVIQEANAGVESVRRLEAQEDEFKAEQLAKTQWIFRKNPESHTERETERLEQMDWKHLMTVLAYQMRLILQDIYNAPTLNAARKDLKAWCRWVKDKAQKAGHNLLQPMVRVAAMVERHLEGILGHWKEGLTTAYLEGLNSLFSATKRKARGYRTTKNLLTMLYFVAGKLHIPCH
jgi:transposase